MILKMYSICDSKAAIFYPPIFKNTHGEAERDFAQATNDPKTTIHQYPEDYDLYFIGEYDNSTGKMSPLDTPQHITKAVFLKKASASNDINQRLADQNLVNFDASKAMHP